MGFCTDIEVTVKLALAGLSLAQVHRLLTKWVLGCIQKYKLLVIVLPWIPAPVGARY